MKIRKKIKVSSSMIAPILIIFALIGIYIPVMGAKASYSANEISESEWMALSGKLKNILDLMLKEAVCKTPKYSFIDAEHISQNISEVASSFNKIEQKFEAGAFSLQEKVRNSFGKLCRRITEIDLYLRRNSGLKPRHVRKLSKDINNTVEEMLAIIHHVKSSDERNTIVMFFHFSQKITNNIFSPCFPHVGSFFAQAWDQYVIQFFEFVARWPITSICTTALLSKILYDLYTYGVHSEKPMKIETDFIEQQNPKQEAGVLGAVNNKYKQFILMPLVGIFFGQIGRKNGYLYDHETKMHVGRPTQGMPMKRCPENNGYSVLPDNTAGVGDNNVFIPRYLNTIRQTKHGACGIYALWNLLHMYRADNYGISRAEVLNEENFNRFLNEKSALLTENRIKKLTRSITMEFMDQNNIDNNFTIRSHEWLENNQDFIRANTPKDVIDRWAEQMIDDNVHNFKALFTAYINKITFNYLNDFIINKIRSKCRKVPPSMNEATRDFILNDLRRFSKIAINNRALRQHSFDELFDRWRTHELTRGVTIENIFAKDRMLRSLIRNADSRYNLFIRKKLTGWPDDEEMTLVMLSIPEFVDDKTERIKENILSINNAVLMNENASPDIFDANNRYFDTEVSPILAAAIRFRALDMPIYTILSSDGHFTAKVISKENNRTIITTADSMFDRNPRTDRTNFLYHDFFVTREFASQRACELLLGLGS